MATVTDNTSTVFAHQIAQEVTDLPEIHVKPGMVDLALAINTIRDGVSFRVPAATNDQRIEDKTIVAEVCKKYNELKGCPQHRDYFATISKLANMLGANVTGIFNILSTSIKPEVDSLKETVLARIQQGMEADGSAGALVPLSYDATGFTVVEWDNILRNVGGTENVAAWSKELTGHEMSFNPQDLLQLLTICDREMVMVPITDTEVLDDIKARVAEKLQPNQAPAFEQIMGLIQDTFALKSLVHIAVGKAIDSNDYPEILRNARHVVEDLAPVLDIMKTTDYNVSDAFLESWTKMMDGLQRYVLLAGYTLVYIRQTYSGALVIDYTTLNGDTYPQFTQDGGTDEDIARYIYVNYSSTDTPIPAGGVAGSVILEEKEDTIRVFEERKAAMASRASTIQLTHTVQALRTVLLDYVESTDPSRLPQGKTLDEFVRSKQHLIQAITNHLNIDDDSNLEALLYDFVISCWHDGTLVQAAHQLFGMEVVRQLQANPELDTESEQLIDATVASKLIAKFLFDEVFNVEKNG